MAVPSGFKLNLKVSDPFSFPYSTFILNLSTPNPVSLNPTTSSPSALRTFKRDLATAFPTAVDSSVVYFLVSSDILSWVAVAFAKFSFAATKASCAAFLSKGDFAV